MNLWDLHVNDIAFIDSVTVEKSSKISAVLSDLGLQKDALIKCLHKTIFNGPRVYEIGGITCTLCKQGAQKVLIHK